MHPILFYITDTFYISTYGLLVVMGLAAGLGLAIRRAQKTGFDPNLVVDVALVGVLAGFVGGRAVFILTNWPDFMAAPGAYLFSRSGFVFLGGLISGVVAVWWMLRRRMPATMWAFGDVVAPALPLGHMFGRLGCFFTGCCHGGVCEGPLGVRFPEVLNRQGEEIGSMAFLTHKYGGLLEPGAQWSLPVWPSQLFEAGANLLICLALLTLFSRRRFDGQIILLYGALYAIARFLIEFLRGDAERGVFFGGHISTSQIIVLLAFPALLAIWMHRRRRGLTPLPLAAPETSGSAKQAAKSGTDNPKKRRS